MMHLIGSLDLRSSEKANILEALHLDTAVLLAINWKPIQSPAEYADITHNKCRFWDDLGLASKFLWLAPLK